MSESSRPPVNVDGGSRPPDERLVNEAVRFEIADISASRAVAVLVAIFCVFVGTALICWFVLNINKGESDRSAQTPQYDVPADKRPPAPRLEPLDRSDATATFDVFAKQLAMEHMLQSYGDTADPGFVHIPIEQAMMAVIAELPVRQTTDRLPAKGFGLIGGGESNSGRLYSESPLWLREKK